jgi:hypothetical protein
VITRGFAAMERAPHSTAEAFAIIDELAARFGGSAVAGDERAIALRKDVTGRMHKSLDGNARFQRWGGHYMRALLRAHELQQCTNVLDFGVQCYGGSLFAALRERGNALFMALPPPVVYVAPTAAAAAAAPPTPVDMVCVRRRVCVCVFVRVWCCL